MINTNCTYRLLQSTLLFCFNKILFYTFDIHYFCLPLYRRNIYMAMIIELLGIYCRVDTLHDRKLLEGIIYMHFTIFCIATMYEITRQFHLTLASSISWNKLRNYIVWMGHTLVKFCMWLGPLLRNHCIPIANHQPSFIISSSSERVLYLFEVIWNRRWRTSPLTAL